LGVVTVDTYEATGASTDGEGRELYAEVGSGESNVASSEGWAGCWRVARDCRRGVTQRIRSNILVGDENTQQCRIALTFRENEYNPPRRTGQHDTLNTVDSDDGCQTKVSASDGDVGL
jgi:hypothetical protein